LYLGAVWKAHTSVVSMLPFLGLSVFIVANCFRLLLLLPLETFLTYRARQS